jgi:hypothetical protein
VRQIDQHGWVPAFEFSHQIANLPHSADTVEWAAQWLERSAPKHDADLLTQQLQVARWLRDAPVEWLRPHLDRFCQTVVAAPPPETGSIASDPIVFRNDRISFDRMADRLATENNSTEHCLTRLEEVLSACLKTDGFPHAEVAQLEVLCESLAARKTVPDETIRAWLDIDADPNRPTALEHFRAGAALLLLAAGDQPPPVDPLLKFFPLDWDWIEEAVVKAFVATGDTTTLRTLLDRYAGLDWSARLFLTEVFEKRRFEDCEPALQDALQGEKDDFLRVHLAVALALYGTPESIALAQEVAREDPQDPERDEILDLLWAHDILRGNQNEETIQYRRKLARRHAKSLAADRQIKALMSGSRELDLSSLREFPVATLKKPGKEAKKKPFQPATPDPYPGVGRNDPCPCGSGKKFKKCCLP